MKLDELLEQERVVRQSMTNRAGVLGLMLHSAFDHALASRFEQQLKVQREQQQHQQFRQQHEQQNHQHQQQLTTEQRVRGENAEGSVAGAALTHHQQRSRPHQMQQGQPTSVQRQPALQQPPQILQQQQQQQRTSQVLPGNQPGKTVQTITIPKFRILGSNSQKSPGVPLPSQQYVRAQTRPGTIRLSAPTHQVSSPRLSGPSLRPSGSSPHSSGPSPRLSSPLPRPSTSRPLTASSASSQQQPSLPQALGTIVKSPTPVQVTLLKQPPQSPRTPTPQSPQPVNPQQTDHRYFQSPSKSTGNANTVTLVRSGQSDHIYFRPPTPGTSTAGHLKLKVTQHRTTTPPNQKKVIHLQKSASGGLYLQSPSQPSTR